MAKMKLFQVYGNSLFVELKCNFDLTMEFNEMNKNETQSNAISSTVC